MVRTYGTFLIFLRSTGCKNENIEASKYNQIVYLVELLAYLKNFTGKKRWCFIVLNEQTTNENVIT